MNTLKALSILSGLGLVGAAVPGRRAAEDLFREARFRESEVAYRKALAADPRDRKTGLGLARLDLLSNRLADVERWSRDALAKAPGDRAVHALLAEALYRQDRFREAAPHARSSGQAPLARKLASFKGVVPYAVARGTLPATVDFVTTDPLPVVPVCIDGGEPSFFFIDTGGSEVIIDPALADRVGAQRLGAERGSFAGKTTAPLEHGRIRSLSLGGLELEALPVQILETRQFSSIFGGLPIEGILGTALLYHFESTLDYPNGRLILERRGLERPAASGEIRIPFLLGGEHYMLVSGTVNGKGPLSLLVDTGLAGAAFAPAERTWQELKLESGGQAAEGVGGGGKVRVTPFAVEEIALGEARVRGLTGLHGAFPRALERDLGFRIDGIVSHAFFRNYALTFLFDRMEIVLTPAREEVALS